MDSQLKILSLDLSMSSTGYAVLETDGELVKVVELGHIDNKKQGRAKWSHGKRLSRIFSELKVVINRHPDISVVVREKGVTRFNKATQVIFRVVGVVDLLLETVGLHPSTEVGITEAKKLITGSGKADKEQIAQKVVGYLSEPVDFSVDDESDAVAVGVAYMIKEGITHGCL